MNMLHLPLDNKIKTVNINIYDNWWATFLEWRNHNNIKERQIKLTMYFCEKVVLENKKKTLRDPLEV